MWPFNVGKDFASGNYIFDAVMLISYPDKYKYCGYGIGLDNRRSFSLLKSSVFGKNMMIFGTDMSSLVHLNN